MPDDCCLWIGKKLHAAILARVGVGVGEATLSPSSLSMIGTISKRKRGSFGFIQYWCLCRFRIAFIIGGQIIAYVASRDNLILPIIGEIYPWQALFIMVDPGLIVAALMMTVKEPERREKL